MNKVEKLKNHYQVVSYNGDIISKEFKTLEDAQNRLDQINIDKEKHNDNFLLIETAFEFAIADIALLKKHKYVAITDTKHGIVWMEYDKKIFSMRFGKQLLKTDNELMIVDILKGLYNWEVENKK